MRWLRINRWWLLALPVALLVLVAGSSYRVKMMWYDATPRDVVASAPQGKSVQVSESFEDVHGQTTRTFTVTLDGVQRVDELPKSYQRSSTQVPEGVHAYSVRLSFAAEPDQNLRSCLVAVQGRSGAVYGNQISDPLGQVLPCLPEGHPGPEHPFLDATPRGVAAPGEERPPRWQVSPIVLMAADDEPAKVWLVSDVSKRVELSVK